LITKVFKPWGEMLHFFSGIFYRVYSGRVLRFFSEVLRQASVLVTGSMIIVLGMVFTLGLECGVEGAYLMRSIGSSSITGAFTALCDLREVIPYAFGYMLAAKVGTGIVAELGSMRISDEIDALEVLGLDSKLYLGATRLLGIWLVLPFLYMLAVVVGFIGSYIVVVTQIGEVSAGGYLQFFWQFQNPLDLMYSVIKTMVMATFIVIVGIYYGYNVSGGPVGVGTSTAKSMVANIFGIHLIGFMGTQVFWGGNARLPIGG
jgi:phospholipid/cholesterol/gamma-HCH transport system permease protein